LLAAVGYTVAANGTVSANFTGSGYTRNDVVALKTVLDNYNNNKGCPA
jgi:hypothetical protein